MRILKTTLLTLFVCTLFTVPASAQASGFKSETKIKLLTPSKSFNPQWLEEVKHAPTPKTTVYLRFKQCPYFDSGGCAQANNIWVSPWYDVPGREDILRFLFYHELGHVFDYNHLSFSDQDKIKVALGYPVKHEWRDEYKDKAPPGEWFAEAASMCWAGDRDFSFAYDFPFTSVTQPPIAKTCQIMRNAYRRSTKPVVRRHQKYLSKSVKNWRSTSFSTIKSLKIITSSRTITPKHCSGKVKINRRAMRYNFCSKRVVIKNKPRVSLRIIFRAIK